MNIVCWSGGKDSTATIILAHQHNIPIDKIVFSEVMFSIKDNISGENPEHIDFMKNVAIPKFNEWGYSVDIVRADEDFLSYFWKKHQGHRTPERKGKYYGWLMSMGCWGNSHLKVAPMDKYMRNFPSHTKIVGIALDEPQRWERAKSKGQRSLLVEYEYTERMALNLCKEYDLLSPIYADEIGRGGCWFCPNQRIAECANTKIKHPELWSKIKELGDYLESHIDQFVYDYKANFLRGKRFSQVEREVDEYLAKKANEISIFKEAENERYHH